MVRTQSLLYHSTIVRTQMQKVWWRTKCEAIQHISGRWPVVFVVTVKGNLRHRIEKLGVEIKNPGCWSDMQRVLMNVAIAQHFEELISDHWPRPKWAGGAFVYCTPGHAALLKDAVALLDFTLQSKHLFCSPEYLGALQACLATGAEPHTRGKEAIWKHRAGKLTQWRIIELTGCPRLDTSKVHHEQLPPDIEDFVNAPSTVQCLAPETWDMDVWIQLAINEPAYIAVEDTPNGSRAVCKMCGKKMSCQHLLFEGCWRHLWEKRRKEQC